MPKKQIPIKEGWFHIPESDEDDFYLLGSQCARCGFVHFPKMSACPVCKKNNLMKEIQLSRTGTIDSFTVVQQGPPGFVAPYIQAYVVLPEKVKIFTIIEGVEASDSALKIGEEVEIFLTKICEDEHGNDLIGWKFRPTTQ